MSEKDELEVSHCNFPVHNITSSYCFFYPTNRPKCEPTSFNVINDEEKLQILNIFSLKVK